MTKQKPGRSYLRIGCSAARRTRESESCQRVKISNSPAEAMLNSSEGTPNDTSRESFLYLEISRKTKGRFMLAAGQENLRLVEWVEAALKREADRILGPESVTETKSHDDATNS